MESMHVITAIGELDRSIRKLNTYPVFLALKVPVWKILRRRRLKHILRATMVWLWGESLLARHPKYAQDIFYLAQIRSDYRRMRKYFRYQPWHIKCTEASNVAQGSIDFSGLSELLIRNEAQRDRDGRLKLSPDAHERIATYLSKAYDHFEAFMEDVDPTDVRRVFRNESLQVLGVRELRGKDRFME